MIPQGEPGWVEAPGWGFAVQLPVSTRIVGVLCYEPHPCGGYYLADGVAYGNRGVIGRYYPSRPS